MFQVLARGRADRATAPGPAQVSGLSDMSGSVGKCQEMSGVGGVHWTIGMTRNRRSSQDI